VHISRIKVVNFGRIAEKEVTLLDGKVVVRGKNESGKSTIFSIAPLYAMFGASTLEVTVAEQIRLGEKKMLVELDYGPYTVKRSPSSASVVGNGVQISGQEEVSQFFYKLFGLAKGAESYVLVSEQGDTAGVIAKRQGEAVAFIEAAAGVSQIDDLIEKVKVTFPSGSKAVIEEMIAKSEETSTKLIQELMNKNNELDEDVVEDNIDETKEIIDGKALSLISANALLASSNDRLIEITKHNNSVDLATQTKSSLELAIAEINKEIDVLTSKEYLTISAEDLKQAEATISGATESRRLIALKKLVDSFTIGDEWEGSPETLQQEITEQIEKKKQLYADLGSAHYRIKMTRNSMSNEDVCSLCGSDISKKKDEHNKKLREDLEKYIFEEASIAAETKELDSYLSSMESVFRSHKNRQNIDDINVEADKSVVPHRYKWVGVEPVVIEDAEILAASKLLSDNINSERQRREDSTKLVELNNKAATKYMQVKSIVIEEKKSTEEVQQLIGTLTVNIQDLTALIDQLTKQNQVEITRLVEHQTAVSNLQNRIEEEKKSHADLTKRLRLDERNSKILKSVRDAKPKVLNSVWGTVLESAAYAFSIMRNEPTTVEKTAKGFLANGLSAKSLSGSAKSVFGVAMRDTLRTLFAPTCGFIVFDEPTADADEDRTFAIMGCLESIPGQKIIITHSSKFDAYADQIIEMGV